MAQDSLSSVVDDLQKLLNDRKTGLVKSGVSEEEPDRQEPFDTLDAKKMRLQFAHQLIPLIEGVAGRPATSDDFYTHSGYLIGIDAFRDLYFAFRNCEAVQICFGLDNTLEAGGQLNLVFRGVGASTNELFMTGDWQGDGGGGPDPVNPRPCGRTQCQD